ncbi:AMP-binding protein [Gammaproteobacteria bacterium]|nr:AMP-binding protein [Gammaproteobacteria bacterium]
MNKYIEINKLIEFGLSKLQSFELESKVNELLKTLKSEEAWAEISKNILLPSYKFEIHLYIFTTIYPKWPHELDQAPAYIPNKDDIKNTNLFHFMNLLKINDINNFHQWTIDNYNIFLQKIVNKLKIKFDKPYNEICNLKNGVKSPNWFYKAKLNIINSCFNAPKNKIAIIYQKNNENIKTITYLELYKLTNKIAANLIDKGFKKKDGIAIYMPMTVESIAIYLAIIQIGAIVVSIADSFSSRELSIRLKISNAKGIFSQDTIENNNKYINIYKKIIDSNAPKAIIIPNNKKISVTLRKSDISWEDFLTAQRPINSASCNPYDHINILFSSGTTGTPKAIPWDHTTALKPAIDSYFHHDIKHEDILSWPTNLGWMMGPWLIFASFINQATLALYYGQPSKSEYGKFIQDTKVTMLGVIPTIVANWNQTKYMNKYDWSNIKKFSSTAECSNPEDMLYLMSLAKYKPIIEYCGGTEIGGAYLTSTILEKNYTTLFSTPAIGINFILINEKGDKSNNGEVAIIPPAIGLSTKLINGNHNKTYYGNMPKVKNFNILRRHGDLVLKLDLNKYSMLGRIDDTMNLSGIKISSNEIEKIINEINEVKECAAVAININDSNINLLVIYAVLKNSLNIISLKSEIQKKINTYLNPLFKIHDVIIKHELPRTASNKIIRMDLRKEYQLNH